MRSSEIEEGEYMPDYKKMYLTMAGAAEDVVRPWGVLPAVRFTNAPRYTVRRGRCPHRPAAPAGAELQSLPL